MYVCMYVLLSAFVQIQWVGWMEDYGELAIDAGMRYSDIIVPTLDTVRSSFLIELLLTNNKRVSVYIDHSNCSLLYTHSLYTMWYNILVDYTVHNQSTELLSAINFYPS